MEFVSIHPEFGAEVRGVSLLDVVSRDDAYRAVREAFEHFSILVWRDQDVSDDLQATASRAFGPLEVTKVGSLGEGTVYGRITNIGPDGQPVPPDHRQALVGKANALWHTDSSFKQTPAVASMLSARIVPSEGGATEFVSTRAAWARLPAAERAALQDLVVEHSYLYSRERIDPDLVTPAERTALPPVRKRLTWRNPANGLRSLYLASHAGAIDGMSREAGKALLQRLTDEATAPAHVYAHRWRVGDVVLWDNRATMHRGRPFPLGERRSMVRTTISATAQDGLNEVIVIG
jgi:alpha-ketoglutarate-dependent 2,4-dichlorophenoxyacetate dioxygenase